MPSTEKHFFISRVKQRKSMQDRFGQPLEIRVQEDIPMVPIRFRFYKQTRTGGQADDTQPFIMQAENIIEFGLPLVQSTTERFRLTAEAQLMEMGVPEEEMQVIYQKLLKVVKLAFPVVPVSVIILDVTVPMHVSKSRIPKTILAPITVIMERLMRFLINSIISSNNWEGMEAFVIFRAANLSSFEDAVRKSECTICLDQVDVVEQGIDHDGEGLIVRLHCSHLFHRDCIIRWLKTSEGCPICRPVSLSWLQGARTLIRRP